MPTSLDVSASLRIRSLSARQALDSRGFAGLEVELALDDPFCSGRSVSARASRSLCLEDGPEDDPAPIVASVGDRIGPALIGRDFARQTLLDDTLCDLNLSAAKSPLREEALFTASLAFARAAASALRIPLFHWLARTAGTRPGTLPVPLVETLGLPELRSLILAPAGLPSLSESFEAARRIGSWTAKLGPFEGEKAHEQALGAVVQAIEDAGYRPGRDIFLVVDCGADRFCCDEQRYRFEGKPRTSREMASLYASWAAEFPILAFHQPFAWGDRGAWTAFRQVAAKRFQLFTDPGAIERELATGCVLRPSGAVTVTGALELYQLAGQAGLSVCTESGGGGSAEWDAPFAAHVAIALGAGQFKAGPIQDAAALIQYNELWRGADGLGVSGRFAGVGAFSL